MVIKFRTDGNFWTGPRADRLANFSAPFKEGLTFYETDTGLWYFIYSQNWVLLNGGAKVRSQRTFLASDTLVDYDYTIFANSSVAAIVVTLGVLWAGREVVIKNVDNTLGVNIDPGAGLIDGAGGLYALGANVSVTLQSDGTDFWTV